LNSTKQTILQEKTELEETVHVQKLQIARFDYELQAMKTQLDQILREKEPGKKNVKKSIRDLVWDHYIGEDIMKHNCFCCKRVKITIREFHAGHIKSVKDGGGNEVENLRPICHRCNLSMGAQNMVDFIIEHKLYI
jgi:5-methylcytosine-specific restriction endonuclease McrA